MQNAAFAQSPNSVTDFLTPENFILLIARGDQSYP